MKFKVQWLDNSFIEQKAKEFLDRWDPSGEIPIDIEYIVDVEIGVHIVPTADLFPDEVDEVNTDALTSSDLSTIYVDEEMALNPRNENRYRFTLAHEMGHRVLHSELFKSLRFDTVDDYIRFHKQMPEYIRYLLEMQANEFAGRILVPTEELIPAVETQIEVFRKKMQEWQNTPQWEKLPEERVREYAWDRIVERLASRFEVSRQVMEIRILKEGLRQKYPIKPPK